jgi:hypothetical protein
VKQLIERRKYKQNEIRVRVEEIQVIDDMITYINQYRTISSNTAINHLTSDQTNNIFDEGFLFHSFYRLIYLCF